MSSASSQPPGSTGVPLIGETPAFLRDPFRFLEERQRRYGDVFRSNVLFRRVAFLSGIEGAEAFYEPGNVTRTRAHPFTLRAMFGGDNMEMFDGERHLRLKTASLEAFGGSSLASYLPDLERTIEAALARYAHAGEIRAVDELKRLAITCIWTSIAGPPDDAEATVIARDYAAVVRGIDLAPDPAP